MFITGKGKLVSLLTERSRKYYVGRIKELFRQYEAEKGLIDTLIDRLSMAKNNFLFIYNTSKHMVDLCDEGTIISLLGVSDYCECVSLNNHETILTVVRLNNISTGLKDKYFVVEYDLRKCSFKERYEGNDKIKCLKWLFNQIKHLDEDENCVDFLIDFKQYIEEEEGV